MKRALALLLCLTVPACVTGGSFVDSMKADLLTLDFVYSSGESWYQANIVGTAKENECVSSATNLCGDAAHPGQTVKQLHDMLKADYTAAKGTINALIAVADAKKQADIETWFRVISDLVIKTVSLIALLNGPNLNAAVPASAYRTVIKSKAVRQ